MAYHKLPQEDADENDDEIGSDVGDKLEEGSDEEEDEVDEKTKWLSQRIKESKTLYFKGIQLNFEYYFKPNQIVHRFYYPKPDARNSSSLPIFRSRLKTHLFHIAFPP